MPVIERECGIKLSVREVGNYLKRWSFTPQKPIKKAYEQRTEAIQDCLNKEYPAIEARAKLEQPRFAGATKRRWSTRMCAVAATRRSARSR
jgi:hypothetical protein